MKIAIDLHIHTALSPCAERDMTPNNIVNMAILKGLDAISITDHNACDNVEAVLKIAGKRLIVLPGIEVQTREDVHLLCYFADIIKLRKFDAIIKKHQIIVPNIPELFGFQYILDEKDQIIRERNESLISSTNLSIDEVVMEARRHSGVVIPAHIDRKSYSIISNLGFIPKNLDFKLLEISHNYALNNSFFIEPFHIFSSDAHCLADILEREMFLEVKQLTSKCLIEALRN